MHPTIKTRKPIDKLEITDFEIFPIWEFATDEEGIEEQDETWVRPVDSKVAPLGSYSLSVAAQFLTSSGKTFVGFVELSTESTIKIGHAVLLHNNHYIFVPSSRIWNVDKAYANVVEILGISLPELFPLRFTLSVFIEGEQNFRSGIIVI